MGRSPQICTVTNFREEFWIYPLWCLFLCFSLTFGVYVMKKYIPELSYFFSQFSSHIYMSRVRTWQLTFSPNHMKWAFWINKITFFLSAYLLVKTKSHNFQKLDNNWMVWGLFCDLYRLLKSSVIMGGHPNIDGHHIKTVCPTSFSAVILQTQWC